MKMEKPKREGGGERIYQANKLNTHVAQTTSDQCTHKATNTTATQHMPTHIHCFSSTATGLDGRKRISAATATPATANAAILQRQSLQGKECAVDARE